MMDNKFSSRQVPVNNFSAAASVQIAIWRFIFGKSKSVFSPRTSTSTGGSHPKLLKYMCDFRKSQSFVLQQMKCGLLDNDNPADWPWRKVAHPPLWACHSLTHSLTHSFTRSLAHSLTASLPHCLTASLAHSLTHRPLLRRGLLQNSNTAPFWLMAGSLEQSDFTQARSQRPSGASSGRPSFLVHAEGRGLVQFRWACLAVISD